MWKYFYSLLELAEPKKASHGFLIWIESFTSRWESPETAREGPSVLWIVGLLLTGWLLSLISIMLSRSFFPTYERKPCKTIFFAAFHEKIRKVFKQQRQDTLATITVGTNRVLKKNNEEPTVFLVLVPWGAMDTATQLVTLLTHCTLLAYQYPADHYHVDNVTTDGNKYTSYNDEWPFFYRLKKQLKYQSIAVVFNFEKLHPQAVKTLQLLTPLLFAPFPESVLILVADVGNRFSEHQKLTTTANNLGKIYLRELLGPYMDQRELAELIIQIGSRCLLVNPEGRNHQSVLPFC